jgi:chromosome partitioning protein
MSTSLLGGRYYKQVMQRVREDYSENKIFNTHIPTDINVSKAVDRYMPVVITDPKSSGAQALTTFTKEFLQKIDQATDQERKNTKFRFA